MPEGFFLYKQAMGAYSLKIKALPEAERPRERLLAHGAQSLRDSELLAILLRTGTADDSAIALAGKLLSYYEGDLHAVSKLSATALAGSLKGIGQAKAAQIVAAFELGRRATSNGGGDKAPLIDDPRAAAALLRAQLGSLAHEEFWILLLNPRGRLIGKRRITSGAGNATVIEPADVFKVAMNERAAAVILAHNHPGGDCEPSEDDIELTQRLVNAGAALGVQVLDHLVIAGEAHCSLVDLGVFPAAQ